MITAVVHSAPLVDLNSSVSCFVEVSKVADTTSVAAAFNGVVVTVAADVYVRHDGPEVVVVLGPVGLPDPPHDEIAEAAANTNSSRSTLRRALERSVPMCVSVD